MNGRHLLCALLGSLAMLSGCAGNRGPVAGAAGDSDSLVDCARKPAAGKGQIWIYRTAPKGLGVAPEIVVDDRRYEALLPGAGYRLEVAPGQHRVKLAYDTDQLDVMVDSGQDVFVRFDLDPALLGKGFFPVLVDRPTAQAELLRHAGIDFGCVK